MTFRLLVLTVALWMATLPAAAEELVLKNGQKIVGTIVSYENDMFRVETEYGFALVRKDQIKTVNFSDGPKTEAAKKAKSTSSPSPASPPVPAEKFSPTTAVAPPREPVKPAAAPPPPSRPVDEPLPTNLQEHVEGTTYVNDSFHFAMFKPPGWKVYEEVPKETGSAIMAIGTEDEQTLLFIDRQVWSGTPDFKSDSAETKLRSTYQEYHKLLESPTELGGQPAIRRVFNGVIDGIEWHGVSVHLAQGNAVFGIIGLTSAETYQFQQALFNKIMNSFHFLALTSPATSPPASRPSGERR
jgi:hypothetical protein